GAHPRKQGRGADAGDDRQHPRRRRPEARRCARARGPPLRRRAGRRRETNGRGVRRDRSGARPRRHRRGARPAWLLHVGGAGHEGARGANSATMSAIPHRNTGCDCRTPAVTAEVIDLRSASIHRRHGTLRLAATLKVDHRTAPNRGDAMRKTLTALAAAATLATATVTVPSTAEARWGWRGGAFIGGLAAGAIIASAFARPYYYGGYYGGYGGYYGGYGGYYGGYPAYYGGYYAPAPVYYSYYGGYPAYYGGYWGRCRYQGC